MYTIENRPTASRFAIVAMAVIGLAASATLRSANAQDLVLKKNTGASAENALIPFCAVDAAGDGDGPKTQGDPDGNGKLTLKAKALTMPQTPDLAITRVNGTLESSRYTLSYCIINRGGKPAHGPIAVAVVAGDVVLQELTSFRPIPSLSGTCFGSGDRETLPPAAKMDGATVQVTSATGETALLNNKCRIQWGK